MCYSRPRSPAQPSPSKSLGAQTTALQWKSTQASSQAFGETAESPHCAFCDCEATGFCVGCLAVRYCGECYAKEHGKKNGLHLFCSYSGAGTLKWSS